MRKGGKGRVRVRIIIITTIVNIYNSHFLHIHLQAATGADAGARTERLVERSRYTIASWNMLFMSCTCDTSNAARGWLNALA